MSISEGTSFYAHEASINYSPMQFILDFRCVTPRVDPRSRETPTLHMTHNVVMIDPLHAKNLHHLLGEMLSKYEKDFGTIEKPKALKIMEKKNIKAEKSEKTSPNYFG